MVLSGMTAIAEVFIRGKELRHWHRGPPLGAPSPMKLRPRDGQVKTTKESFFSLLRHFELRLIFDCGKDGERQYNQRKRERHAWQSTDYSLCLFSRSLSRFVRQRFTRSRRL